MTNSVGHIFDVTKKGQAMRGFLDVESQEIVIYDDLKGKELFRIGGNGQSKSAKPKTKKKLNTLTFVICNGSNEKKTATLFASNLEPLIQPLGVSVIIKEIENRVFNSHNYLRRDILSNKLKIEGFSYFVQNTQQFNNNLEFGTIKPYGVVQTIPFAPSNYLSAHQIANKMMDMSKNFNWNVDARSVMYVPIEPKSKVTLMFNVVEDVEEPLINKDDDYNDYTDYTEYKDCDFKSGAKRRPIRFDADYSNTIFKNVNSGGLGAVNFDGSNEDEVVNTDKKKDSVVGLIKFGIVVIGAGLILNALLRKVN